ncbi:12522_t:CDS:2 [Dentiscutata heterogama]|uniref:12522_t:CDS:1 n=1 Tax=Dentiscutata heterogama TaxID=1316150 RepID=A0ACA9M0Y5_9GLOM|nr:12522_t:CDS:2 [Dentiscutata heterogama]
MEIIVIYSTQSVRFRHLGVLGSNIKRRNTYLISGLVKFSDSGKIMMEASDIDYQKLPLYNLNTFNNQSFTNRDGATASTSSSNIFPTFTYTDMGVNSTSDIKDYPNSGTEKNDNPQTNHEEVLFSDKNNKSTGENEDEEDKEQPKKRKQSVRTIKIKKKKKAVK